MPCQEQMSCTLNMRLETDGAICECVFVRSWIQRTWVHQYQSTADVASEIRCAIFTMPPDFEKLCRNTQVHVSHQGALNNVFNV